MSPFTIVAVILFVGVLVFVHEMGHFLAAKYFDIKVTKFSLGFGPPLLSFTKGETTYQVAAIPLGGYVRMVGDNPNDPLPPEDKGRAFATAPIYQRALVALAGPAANLAFPVVCFFAFHLLEPEVQPPVIGQVEPGEPADRGGLKAGDRVLSVDGERAWSFVRFAELVSARPGLSTELEVLRGEEKLTLNVTPKSVEALDEFGRPKVRGMISANSLADAPTIGIEDASKLPDGGHALETGDRIVSIGGRRVERGDRLDAAFARVAGRQVEVVVVRAHPRAAGDTVRAEGPEALRFEIEVPSETRSMSDLGLSLGAAFVRTVVPGGAADKAGLRPGDRVLSVRGRPLQHFWRFALELSEARGSPVPFEVVRGGQVLKMSITAEPVKCLHPIRQQVTTRHDPGFGRGPRVTPETNCEYLRRPDTHWGATLDPELEKAHLSIDEALSESVRLTGHIIGLLTTYVFKTFVTREVSTDALGGPLQFMNVAAKAAEAGILTYLKMLAFISINLGVFNLLPVPVLDGGHLVFCLIEAVKRKPLSPQVRERASMVGLALLAFLLLLALRNDLRSFDIF